MSEPTAKELATINKKSHRACAEQVALDISSLCEQNESVQDDIDWEDIHQRLVNIYNEVRPNEWE